MTNTTSLTDKQERFCKEYIIDLNATQAAIRAGYSKKTAKEIGCQNLTKLNIQEHLSKLMEEKAIKLDITAEEVLKVIHETMMNAKAEGDRKDVYKGAELLGKYFKLFTDKIEHTGKDGEKLNTGVIILPQKDG